MGTDKRELPDVASSALFYKKAAIFYLRYFARVRL